MQNLETEKKNSKGTIIRNYFEHFSDPKFIAVASKIGIEIDSGQEDHTINKLESAFQMSEGQKIENTKQDRCRTLTPAVANRNDVRPEGPPKIDSLVEYPRLGEKPASKPEGLPSQEELIASNASPYTPKGIGCVIPHTHLNQSVLWEKISKMARASHQNRVQIIPIF